MLNTHKKIKICWILIIGIFHWILGFNLKPNQTFDQIFRHNHGHSNQSPPQIQYLVFVFGFNSHVTIVFGRRAPPHHTHFYLELKTHKSACGQSLLQYCGRAAAGPSWHFVILETGLVGTRLLATPPCNTNRFCRLTPRPVAVWSKTAESHMNHRLSQEV